VEITMTQQRVDATRLAGIQGVPVGVQVVRAGQESPAPDDVPVEGAPAYERVIKPPEEHQTIADRLDYLCDVLGGAKHRRTPLQDGVKLVVELLDGTVLGGRGRTTAEAFNGLLENAQRFFDAGLNEGGAR
jgi:hypothetical protein